MYERIIVTDDGSELARSAIPRTATIAVACDAEVLVLRVSRAEGDDADGLDDEDWRAHVGGAAAARDRAEPREAEPRLSTAVDALSARGVERVGSLLVKGNDIAASIANAADELGAGLLVMTTHGLGGSQRAVLGSVASDVVRRADGVPVLLCRPAGNIDDARVERVLLTLDGSDLAARALPHAEHLTRVTGAELVLMRVNDSDEERGAARDDLEARAATLRASGLAGVQVELADGDAGETIVAAVERLDVDVVVMATRGRGGLARALLGSVADFVSREVEGAAVLLVPPKDD